MSAGPATAAPAHDLTNPGALGPWERDNYGFVRKTTHGWLGASVTRPGGAWRWFAMNVSGKTAGGSAATEAEAKRAADEALARLDGQPVRSPS